MKKMGFCCFSGNGEVAGGTCYLFCKVDKGFAFSYHMSDRSSIEGSAMQEKSAEGCQEPCFHPDIVARVVQQMPGEPMQQELAQRTRQLRQKTTRWQSGF